MLDCSRCLIWFFVFSNSNGLWHSWALFCSHGDDGKSLFVSVSALGSSELNFSGHVLYVVLIYAWNLYQNNFASVAEDSAAQSSNCVLQNSVIISLLYSDRRIQIPEFCLVSFFKLKKCKLSVLKYLLSLELTGSDKT